jgi:ABC-2 type transport system ATP-binding protein
MAEVAVLVEGLRRVFPGKGGKSDRVALDGLELVVGEGEVRGLLGPNGAGKTTLCKILSTVLLPTSGHARVCGVDVVSGKDEVRRTIGIVFGGERGLYTRMTARQNLRYWSAMYGITGRKAKQRAEFLLERVGLGDRGDERVETFSRGMKQRLHLARGLVGDPRLVILDEPTVGMDPVAALEFRSLVGELRAEGRTLLITTHDMAEAEAVCDRVSLIDKGRVLRTEDPRTIGGWITTYDRVRALEVPAAAVAAIRDLPGVVSVRENGSELLVEVAASGAAGAVLRTLLDAGVTRLSSAGPSLEDVYLQVIGNRGLSV